jgi:glycosyltransferase EpsD
MKWFKDQGWEVHVAANGDMNLPFVDKKYNIQISRSPLSWSNHEAYNQLKTIIGENEYGIIHCHTPVGGALARLAARKSRDNGTKVIYTAHGFHFCKGAPLINWLIYYPIERWLAKYTDCLITINEEDYQLAIKHKFKAKKIEHVHGVELIQNSSDRLMKRKEVY